MENRVTLEAEIKSILALKSKEGATYQEIRDEYFLLMGKEMCFDSFQQFIEFMGTITGVQRARNRAGVLIWFSKSEKSKHIAKMVASQKTPREQSLPLIRKSYHKSTSVCYYNDNYIYKRKYNSDSRYGTKNTHAAFFYDYELIGDDFFLDVANLNFKYPVEYTRPDSKGRSIKKCGHCVSGQFIKDITKMLKSNVKFENNIILNIGSVDLLHGHDLIDLKKDFVDMYKEFESRKIKPVITTLAPLANVCFAKDLLMKWSTFNTFLINNFPNVLDISSCFLTSGQRVLFECYQPSPRYVTGSSQAHCLWNYIGRQRVIKFLKEGVTDLVYKNSIFRKHMSF